MRRARFSLLENPAWSTSNTAADLESALLELFDGVAHDLQLEREDPSDDAFVDYAGDRMSDASVPRPVILRAIRWLRDGSRRGKLVLTPSPLVDLLVQARKALAQLKAIPVGSHFLVLGVVPVDHLHGDAYRIREEVPTSDPFLPCSGRSMAVFVASALRDQFAEADAEFGYVPPPVEPDCCPNSRGWLVMNVGDDRWPHGQIQRCDDCRRFPTEDDAADAARAAGLDVDDADHGFAVRIPEGTTP